MVFFYNIFILLYSGGTWLYGRFNLKAKVRAKAQFRLVEPFPFRKKPVWFHAASVGEFEQALPLYEEMKKRNPGGSFVFSFFSPSGYEYAQKKFPELTIFYLPSDTKTRMSTLVSTIQPKLVIVIKYEFWFHFLNELKKQQIPVFLVSGIFRNKQIFFKPLLGIFFRKMIASFAHLFVQDENSRLLLKSLGIEHVTVSGDTRYDRVMQNKSLPLDDRILSSFILRDTVFIAGSVWKKDKEVVMAIVSVLPRRYQIVIAPHEVEDADFWKKVFPQESVCYSSYRAMPKRILILDTIGVLSQSYRLGSFVYIGGGFGKGIHNILEAAVYNIPVLFGPKYRKFREAVELKELQLAFPVHSPEEAAALISSFSNPGNNLTEIAQKLDEYFQNHANISTRIAVLIEELTKG